MMALASQKPVKPLACQKEPFNDGHRKVQCYPIIAKNADRPEPANKLSDAERQAIIDVSNSERFKSLPASQIVPTLVDEGEYLASERTFYRVLREAGQQNHRGKAARPNRYKPTSYCATAPNQVWT